MGPPPRARSLSVIRRHFPRSAEWGGRVGRSPTPLKRDRRLPWRCRQGAGRTTDGGHPRTPDGQQADDSKMGTERTGADPRTPDGTGRTSGTSRTGGATAARMPQRGTGPNGIRPSGLRGELGEVCLSRVAGEMRRGRRWGDRIGGELLGLPAGVRLAMSVYPCSYFARILDR